MIDSAAPRNTRFTNKHPRSSYEIPAQEKEMEVPAVLQIIQALINPLDYQPFNKILLEKISHTWI